MTTNNRGLGNVFRPTRSCLKCGRAGCDHCGGTGRRQIKTWWIQYSHRGKQYRETARMYSRKVAVKFLKKRLAETGADREFAGPAADRTTFEDLSAMLIADYKVNGRKSIRRARICLKRLGEFFAGSLALDITTDRIHRYIIRRLEEGMAPATVRNEVNALRRTFHLAQQARKVTQLPHFPTIEVRNVRTGFFEREEFEFVLENLPQGLRPIAEFGYLTGWRISEILSLRWTQVDFKAGIVRLEVGSTKNDEGRVLPFHVLPLLESLPSLHAMTGRPEASRHPRRSQPLHVRPTLCGCATRRGYHLLNIRSGI